MKQEIKLQIGQPIKYIENSRVGSKPKIIKKEGNIEKIYGTYILLDLKEYKTCIGIGDLLQQKFRQLKIKVNNEWISIPKEVVKEHFKLNIF